MHAMLSVDQETPALDPSSKLVIEEARRRGIAVEVLAPRAEYYRLIFNGRSVLCRESLSELTSAVGLSLCGDKRMTSRVLRQCGLRVPEQMQAGDLPENLCFLQRHGTLAVKPAHGEQGRGVSVGIRGVESLVAAVRRAAAVSSPVLLEQCVHGEDLRLVVIGGQVIAAAARRAPTVVGTGRASVASLIEAQSRLRQKQTAGESKIPIDEETRRCVQDAGYTLHDVLPKGVTLRVRSAANLHQGGTLHDVTGIIHPALAEVGRRAAQALRVPVLGLDLIVPSIFGVEYWVIEANERPGLANHEPQPTAARFLDLLFPETAALQNAGPTTPLPGPFPDPIPMPPTPSPMPDPGPVPDPMPMPEPPTPVPGPQTPPPDDPVLSRPSLVSPKKS
jgi:GNAT-family acetyltransferase (TIGR03103 family)